MRGFPLRAVLIAAVVWVETVDAEVSIETVIPAHVDSLLVCEVDVRGLPDAESTQTLESGLPSSFVFSFWVETASGEELGRAEVEVRVEPDLWEQRFSVRSPLRDWRVETMTDVRAVMRALGPLPVLPLSSVRTDAARIRTALTVHALAPAEVDELHRVISGESREPDRREVSVGLGSLVRFFLGERNGSKPNAAFDTPLFDPFRLPDMSPVLREPPAAEAETESAP